MIKMNKKGASLKNIFFAVIVVSMVVLAVGTIVGEWSLKYGSGLTYDLDEYSDLDTFSSEAQTQKGGITPADVDPGTGDFEGKILRGGYGILGRVFLPFTSVWNMMESIENRFGLPSYVGEGILTLMVFSIVATVVAILFRLSRVSA